MRPYKYDYTVFPDNSSKIFKETCMKIEKMFPELKKADLLIDVDGSTIQIFGEEMHRIVIYDDYDIGVVFIRADIEIPRIDYWETHKRQNV